jgi:hypothetical protein
MRATRTGPMALDGTSMSGSTTITILGRMLAVMAASRAARASPAKCWFIAMTMRKATPPEDGTATLERGRELLAHALEEARFRQESCFRMWFSVGGHSLANPGQQRLEDGAVPVRDGGHAGDRPLA